MAKSSQFLFESSEEKISFKKTRDWKLIFFTIIASVFLGFILSLGRAFSQDNDIAIECRFSNGTLCTPANFSAQNRFTRYIFLLPAGYQDSERQLFQDDFRRYVERMSAAPGSVYSTSYSGQLIYFAPWLPGGAIDSPTANFSARISNHPFRGKATSLDQDSVISLVQVLRQSLQKSGFLNYFFTSQPLGVNVLFNSELPSVTVNAAPPSLLGQPFGISKVLRGDLDNSYSAVHEMAHAGLNFLDEYTEQGFESLSIRLLDYLTPMALLDNSWSGFTAALAVIFNTYDYRISEILAGNGSENVEVSQFPSRVITEGFEREEYSREGGMFFGRGTYRHLGKNIMNSDRPAQMGDEGFAFAHNLPQWRVLPMAFNGASAPRPNDRIRNAGPGADGHLSIGSSSNVLLYDGDKNHQFFPTVSYDVQAGWYERNWKVCWAAFIPYPCYDSVWTTFQRQVTPAVRRLNLRASALYGLANTLQGVACGLGIKFTLPQASAPTDFCALNVATVSQAFLPTFNFKVPYQEVQVPAQQWFTKYFWRFRTWNGSIRSGWTGWSSFERTF